MRDSASRRVGFVSVLVLAICLVGLYGVDGAAKPKKFCICVFGHTTSPDGIGKAKVKIDGQQIEVDLTQIFSAKVGPSEGLSQAATFVRVANELRREAIKILGEKKVGPLINGNSFTVEAETVEDAMSDDKNLTLKVVAVACKGIKEWNTTKPIPFITKGGIGVKDLDFNEKEFFDKNGDFISCITINNRSAADKVIPGPIILMLNWYNSRGRDFRTPGLNEPNDNTAVFTKVMNVTVPKKDPGAGAPTTTTQGNASIEVNNKEGTVKICWTIKKADLAKKLPGFDLNRKYLAYIDFIKVAGLQGVNYWVKPKFLQKTGTEVCYNWFPTNPVFVDRVSAMQFTPDTSGLPAGWTLTEFAPSPEEILELDVLEMRVGFFCIDIPADTAPETLGQMLIEGVDVETGELLMMDATEIFAVLDVEEAIDANLNNIIDDDEILNAIGFWISGDVVPNAADAISDEKMLALISQWINGEPVSA